MDCVPNNVTLTDIAMELYATKGIVSCSMIALNVVAWPILTTAICVSGCRERRRFKSLKSKTALDVSYLRTYAGMAVGAVAMTAFVAWKAWGDWNNAASALAGRIAL